MIPVKLTLQNFMSYASAQLSFEGIHTACLTGNNGNGKSALLDAMTWAVWGQARGVDKSGAGMDDLVRLGYDEMSVEFCFLLDDQLFRIIRKRDKRRQQSALELQLKAGDDFRSISGDKLSATQEKIIQILKLDYETFVNSAYILQGQADAFTTQKASDRKRILSEILGLSYYDLLERKARDKMNEADYSLKEMDRKLGELEAELAREVAVRQEWESLKSSKLAVESSLRGREAQLEQVLAKLGELQLLSRKREELAQTVARAEEEARDIIGQSAVLRKKIGGLKEILAREDQIAAGYQQLQETSSQEEKENQKQARAMELINQKNALEKAVEQQRSVLASQISALAGQQVQFKLQVDRGCQAEQRIAALEAELETFRLQEQQHNLLREEVVSLKGELASKQSTRQVFSQELAELRQRFKAIKQTVAQCPVCASELTAQQKELLLEQFKSLGEERKDRLDGLEREIASLADRLGQTEGKLKAFEADGKAKFQSRLDLARRDIAEGLQAAEKLREINGLEEALRGTLAENRFAEQEQGELGDVVRELAELSYSQEHHRYLRDQLIDLRGFATQYDRLNEARDGLPAEERLLEQLEARRLRISADNENLRETMNLLTKQAADIPQLEVECSQCKNEINRLREEKSKLDLRFGAVEEELARLERVKDMKSATLKLREETGLRRQHYSQLVSAFSKKGIQAMIIENAVPELQEEANNLLARISDGRMHLALLTQRDTKKGSVAETLDIRISDELGTRKYEMFSGGEAFRVNFALRIALSKLLSRRAGAKLQTLVIDEGFGTQDGSGREKLIDVINCIKEDFVRIIIITHIQELKDAFPVQIEVEKNAEGSTLRLI